MFGERFLLEQIEELSVRRRQHALPELLFHHVAFGLEVSIVDVQTGESIGFGPEQRFQIVRRHDFVINSYIVSGERVIETADVLGEPVHHLRLHVLRALEHDVLEEMRKPTALLRIVFRADVIPDLNRHGRARMIDRAQHTHTVR